MKKLGKVKNWRKRNNSDAISNFELDSFFCAFENILPYLTETDREKFMFSKEFVKAAFPFEKTTKKKIVLGPMEIKTFEYFIFSALVEFEYRNLV